MHRLAGKFLASSRNANPQTPMLVDVNSRHQRVGARLVQVRSMQQLSRILVFF